MELNKIYQGNALDVLRTFPDKSINCCVTSPPYYGLRDYGVQGQIGNEETPNEYIKNLVAIFNEVNRVLTDDGTFWLNIGDTYNGNKKGNTEVYKNKKVSENSSFTKKMWSGAKNKDLIGIPWMLAFALRDRGWYLRQDIIWAKGNPMPEPVKDRCTKSHEYIFLFSKSKKYYFDNESIQEPAKYPYDKRGERNDSRRGLSMNSINGNTGTRRNKRDVWFINTKPCKEAHFAVFPDTLIEPCILAGCPENGVVIDPFIGSGTTGMVSKRNNRNYIGIELNSKYIDIANRRIESV